MSKSLTVGLPDCLNSSEYDHVSADEDDLARDGLEHPCLARKKLLSDGTFYYSTDFDLTKRLQERYAPCGRTAAMLPS